MKRIVLCADGTWNVRDQIDRKTGTRHPTNVTKVARAILTTAANGTAQVDCYHEGVGTGAFGDRLTGGAFGAGIENNIRQLYRFIAYNYDSGDELFFFGFSRGAFTVRTLAGFMNRVGFVQKDDDYCVPELYACYEQNLGPGTPEWSQAFRDVRHLRPCPPIRFIGVWDTVGALGAPGLIGQIFDRHRYRYHDVALNSKIETACHALALDERRAPFAPNMWTRPEGWNGVPRQAWFPGVHCNVGGGYSPDGLANEALHWIVEQAEQAGLEVDPLYLAPFRPCFNSVLNESRTGVYRLTRPLTREVGAHGADGEFIHQSALDRRALAACRYSPVNLPANVPTASIAVINTTRVLRGVPC